MNEIPTDNFGYVQSVKEKKSKNFVALLAVLCALVLGFLVLRYLTEPPKNFPTPYFLRVNSGETLFSISLRAERVSLVRGARTLQLVTILLGGERSIKAGDYYFDSPLPVWEIARRLGSGDFHITPVRVTLPEGFTVSDMAKTLSRLLPSVKADDFTALAKNDEGKLFPDTYFFSPAVTAQDVYQELRENFEAKLTPLRDSITKSGRTEKQILIMASLIEREAFGENDRAIISGILWNRYDRGMLLQVDAPFYFLLGKGSSDLTKTDLKIDSPYNTYVHTGLPPTPIGAPGIASISAAIHPQKTEYLFYLHDKDGVAHYAKTFAEHQKNIRIYLK
jgi:UPF0755 protein